MDHAPTICRLGHPHGRDASPDASLVPPLTRLRRKADWPLSTLWRNRTCSSSRPSRSPLGPTRFHSCYARPLLHLPSWYSASVMFTVPTCSQTWSSSSWPRPRAGEEAGLEDG